MEAVAFDPTGSGRKDHVAFVGISNKRGYLWVIDTRQEAGSDRSGPVDIGDFTYMYDGNSFKVPTYANRSFLNIVAGDFDGDGKESIVVYTPESYNAGGARSNSGTITAEVLPGGARATAADELLQRAPLV